MHHRRRSDQRVSPCRRWRIGCVDARSCGASHLGAEPAHRTTRLTGRAWSRGAYTVGVRRLLAVLVLTITAPAVAAPVHGLVFDDRNGDGRPNIGEPGIAHA